MGREKDFLGLISYEHNDEELSLAIENLNYHMRNKDHFKPYAYSIHNKEFLTEENYATKNVRSSYYINCKLEKCNFFEAGFVGSVFINTQFIDCELSSAKLRSCDFRECEFIFSGDEKREIKSVDFSSSVFNNCKISNVFFNSANFEGVIFNNGIISDNKWRSVSLENAIINKTFLRNMRFVSQNFDFLTLKNISTSNVVFPFPAMPFVFNGLAYVYDTNDNIRFTSCGNGIKRIEKNEYMSLMPQFEIYYKNTDNFFPLANILIAEKRIEDALNNIGMGIMQSIKIKNFRMIYNYCKLLEANFLFTIQHRKKLYNFILNEINKENLSSIDYEILSLYISKIKDILIGTVNEPYVILDCKTNIDSLETDKIAYFISEIERLISLFIGKKEEHFIELRHNSFENFIVQIASDPERLIIFLAAFFQCCGFMKGSLVYLYEKAKMIIYKMKKSNDSKNEDEIKTIINNYEYIQNNTVINVFIQKDINIEEMNDCVFNADNFDNKLQSAFASNSNQKILK